jgi:hypothetical protein
MWRKASTHAPAAACGPGPRHQDTLSHPDTGDAAAGPSSPPSPLHSSWGGGGATHRCTAACCSHPHHTMPGTGHHRHRHHNQEDACRVTPHPPTHPHTSSTPGAYWSARVRRWATLSGGDPYPSCSHSWRSDLNARRVAIPASVLLLPPRPFCCRTAPREPGIQEGEGLALLPAASSPSTEAREEPEAAAASRSPLSSPSRRNRARRAQASKPSPPSKLRSRENLWCGGRRRDGRGRQEG